MSHKMHNMLLVLLRFLVSELVCNNQSVDSLWGGIGMREASKLTE